MKVYLVNDTAAYQEHFGCQLVGQTIREQLARVGARLVGGTGKTLPDDWREIVADADLVLINGEGTLHHGRNLDLLDVAEARRTWLINSVWQENPIVPALQAVERITVRESLSAEQVRAAGAEAEIIPDLIFGAARLGAMPARESRAGGERLVTDDVRMQIHARRGGLKGLLARRKLTGLLQPDLGVDDVLQRLHAAGSVITGRFHVACACLAMGIPFRAWKSNTHKIEGLLADAGHLDCLSDSREEALRSEPWIDGAAARDYVEGARAGIEALFDGVVNR